MNLLALTHRSGIRIAELGFLLAALAGVALALGSVMPGSRRLGGLLGGVALAAGSVLLIIAAHWGHFS